MTDISKIKADLVPFSDEYEQDVRSWIDCEETYSFVCRGKDFPPPESLVLNWQREGIKSYLLFTERKPVAYGELWFKPGDMAVEIAHLIVNNFKRGEGYGVKMVNLLYNRGASRSDVAKVIANIYNENHSALSCFMKAGFEISGTTNYTEGLRLVKLIK